MRFFDAWHEILKIQKFRRMVFYAGFYCFVSVLSSAYTNNTTRAGYSRGDQFYASYPAGTELLTDTARLYKAALGNCFEVEDWGPVEFCIMAKHFERQGKSPYAYHSQYMAHLLSHGQLDGNGCASTAAVASVSAGASRSVTAAGTASAAGCSSATAGAEASSSVAASVAAAGASESGVGWSPE